MGALTNGSADEWERRRMGAPTNGSADVLVGE
jgi:hypothetical protein